VAGSKGNQTTLVWLLIAILVIVWLVALMCEWVTWPVIFTGSGEFIKLASITFTGAYLGFHFVQGGKTDRGWKPVAVIVASCLILFSLGVVLETFGKGRLDRLRAKVPASKSDDTPTEDSKAYSQKYGI
jgi:hypothetical protein